MKKLFFKGCLFSLALFISAVVSYADGNTIVVPPTLNIQGRVTNDSGQPITGKNCTIKLIIDGTDVTTQNVTLDSEGLYNVNADLSTFLTTCEFNKEYKFKVSVQPSGESEIVSEEKTFAAVPYSFYSSTSAYLDVRGAKLVNDNFNQSIDIWTSTNTYSIAVGSAVYSKSASVISSSATEGWVWGMKSDTEQGWLNAGDLNISSATSSHIGGLLLGDSTGLTMDGNGKLIVALDNGTGLKIDSSNRIAITTATASTLGAVYVPTSGGLQIGTDGAIKAKVKETSGLSIDSTNGIQLNLATAGGLKINSNQLAIDYGEVANNNTKAVTGGAVYNAIDAITYTASDGVQIDNKVIKANINTANGLSITSDKIAMSKAGTTSSNLGTVYVPTSGGLSLTTSTGELKAKVKEASGLSIDSTNGIQLNLDTAGGLKINSNQLAIDYGEVASGVTKAVTGGAVYNAIGQITDTKNTAGSTDTSSQIYLVGATSQADYSQTYSHDTVFVDTNGRLNSAAPEANADDNTVATTGWVKGKNYLTSHQTINQDGVTGATIKRYATCSTQAGTAAKTANITSGTFTLVTGARVSVNFANVNTANNPTLNINSKGAKNIYHRGTQITNTGNKALLAGVCDFIYDEATGWHLVGNYIDTNTTTATKLGSGENDFSSSNINNGQVWVKDNNGKQGWVDLKNTGGYTVGGADLAEIYKSTEDLQPGDVVSIDTTRDDAIVKTRTAEDTLVAGVISTEPGLLLNSAEKGYKLALVGKVPTKVCNEGGDIKRGDLLVSASIAGYAKKAGDNPKPGTVIGKALENFSSKRGTILVLVNLQ